LILRSAPGSARESCEAPSVQIAVQAWTPFRPVHSMRAEGRAATIRDSAPAVLYAAAAAFPGPSMPLPRCLRVAPLCPQGMMASTHQGADRGGHGVGVEHSLDQLLCRWSRSRRALTTAGILATLHRQPLISMPNNEANPDLPPLPVVCRPLPPSLLGGRTDQGTAARPSARTCGRQLRLIKSSGLRRNTWFAAPRQDCEPS
jgi:hypothetical protein